MFYRLLSECGYTGFPAPPNDEEGDAECVFDEEDSDDDEDLDINGDYESFLQIFPRMTMTILIMTQDNYKGNSKTSTSEILGRGVSMIVAWLQMFLCPR